MKLRIVLAALFALLAAACATQPQTAAGSPERAVEDSYSAFRSALLAGDGDTAAELATVESWNFFGDMAIDALRAERHEVERMSLDRQLIVLVLRHGLTVEQLHTMSGEALLAHLIDEGWIWIAKGWVKRDTLATARLSDFYVLQQRASASGDGERGTEWPVGLGATFRYEREGWRVEFHFKSAEYSHKTRIIAAYFYGDRYRRGEDYIYGTLQNATGRPAGPGIWNPPL